MVNWSELESKYKLLIVALACLIAGGAVWYLLIRPLEQANQLDRQALQSKRAEIAQLRPYQARIVQLTREIESLQQQVESHRKIVPEERQIDSFIRSVQQEAHSSGIEIRRYTVMPVVAREFYSESPVELELDGPFFGVLQFYERLAGMERLVNVSGLQMSNVRNPSGAKAKKIYQYAPKETVVATCIATAFFNPPAPPAPPPAPALAPGVIRPVPPPAPPGQAPAPTPAPVPQK
jgi:type IV pilus assembly protein PilO